METFFWLLLLFIIIIIIIIIIVIIIIIIIIIIIMMCFLLGSQSQWRHVRPHEPAAIKAVSENWCHGSVSKLVRIWKVSFQFTGLVILFLLECHFLNSILDSKTERDFPNTK